MSIRTSLIALLDNIPKGAVAAAKQAHRSSYRAAAKEALVELNCMVSSDLRYNDNLNTLLQTALNATSSTYLSAIPLLSEGAASVGVKVLRQMNPNSGIRLEALDTNHIDPKNFDFKLPTSEIKPVRKQKNFFIATEGANATVGDNKAMEVPSNLAVGKLLDVTVPTEGEGKGYKFQVIMKFHTTIVDNGLMGKLLNNRTIDHTFKERWHRYMAGSISFWGDLIFANDIIKQRKRLAMLDKRDLMTTIANRKRLALANAAANNENNYGVSSNCAIVSSNVVRQVERDSRGDIEKMGTRDRIMDNMGLMLLVVVDLEDDMVTFWFDGNRHPVELTMSSLEAVNRKDGPKIQDIMGVIQSGDRTRF